MSRLLLVEQIPEELWDGGKNLLIIPDALHSAYLRVIERRGIATLLQENFSDGPIGGVSQAETESHFVNRFDGSLARIQLALLDPRDELEDTSDTLLFRLVGGNTCIADAPCGAGAGVLSALVVVARLRELEVLPRMPLDVRLVAADISPHARELAQEMLDEVRQDLERQAINISVEWVGWDVTCSQSNTHLVRRLVITSDGCAKKLLLVANFSGFLAISGKTKAAEPQLAELFRYFSGAESAALWLEPGHNSATKPGGVIDWLIKTANDKWSWFATLSKSLSRDKRGFNSNAKFRTLLRNSEARVNLCVAPIDLDASR